MAETQIASAPSSVRLIVPDRLIEVIPAETREDRQRLETFLLRSLEIGIKCLAVAGIHLDTEVVRTEFARMQEAIGGVLAGLKGFTTKELTAEDSRLLTALKNYVSKDGHFGRKIRELSDDLADPNKAGSVPARTRQLLDEFFTAADSPFQKALNLANPDSPFKQFLDRTDRKLGLYRKELDERLRPFEERFGKLEANIQRVLDQVGYRDDLKEVHEKSSAKAKPFEEAVADVLTSAASHNKDRVEPVGEVLVDGTRVKRGDVLVHVEQESDEVGRIVAEAKSGAYTLAGKDGLLKQLADAMTFRDAQAGIAVVAQEHAGKRQRAFDWQGTDRIVVVVDPANEDGGFLPLEVAYAVLRDRVLARAQEGTGEGPDLATAEKTILEIGNALNSVQSMKKNCTELSKNARNVRGAAEEMELAIRTQLATLRRQLGLG